MNRRAAGLVLLIVVMWAGREPGRSQVVIQPTSLPTVTADNESWYLNGEPIAYAGNLYYPSGTQIYFNATEMVRSGFFMGVPL